MRSNQPQLPVVRRPGTGPGVLLLHGLTASSASWVPVMDALPAYACVAPDLLGFGQSPKPPESAYDLEAHCDAIEAVVAEVKPICIVGHSMGAVIALELLRRHPEIPAGVLVSPAVFASHGQAQKAMKHAPIMHRLTLKSEWAAGLMCRVMCAWRPMLQRIAPLVARRFPPAVVRAGLDHTWTSYSRSMANVVTAGLVPGLMAAVGSRVTIVHGRDDTTVPLSLVTPLQHMARAFEVIDGDHQAHLLNPGAVADVIARAAPAGVP